MSGRRGSTMPGSELPGTRQKPFAHFYHRATDGLTLKGAGKVAVAFVAFVAVIILAGRAAAIPVEELCVQPPFGMVSWWPGDDNAQDIVDSNDGTLIGTGFAPGEVLDAFSFDGSDDTVDFGNRGNLQVSSGDFSVDAWVKFKSLTGDQSIVDKMNAPTTVVNSDGWRLLKQADNHIWFCFGGGTVNGCQPSASTTVRSNATVNANIFYHIAAVKSGSSIRLYINGSLDNTNTLTAFTDTNSVDLFAGSDADSSAFMNGLIDEIELFNRALTATEIQSIFSAGSIGKCKEFDDALRTSYYDVATSFAPSKSGYGGLGSSGGAGDNTVRAVNPTSVIGNLCAMVYVFDDTEQLEACCGCPITPDGLRTWSVINDLTFNFGTNRGNLNAGVIDVIATRPNFEVGSLPALPPPPGTNFPTNGTEGCSPTGGASGDPRATAIVPNPTLRLWITHSELLEPGLITRAPSVSSSAEDFLASPLDVRHLFNLQIDCAKLITNGSNAGTCACGAGDLLDQQGTP
jgi:hypothetical protein